jgi:hypothetical protein
MNRTVIIVAIVVLIAIGAILYFVFAPAHPITTTTATTPMTTTEGGGCAITPPENTKVNREVALKVAADLTKLTKMPVSGETTVNAKNTAEETFQKIPDADVACHMLLETIACLSRDTRNQATVQSLLGYIKDGDKCGPQTPPKNGYELRIQGQSTTTTSDHFALDLGYVETGKELTLPLTLIARLPGNPPLRITHVEQPVGAKWQGDTDSAVASEQSPAVLTLTVPAQQAGADVQSEIRISPTSIKPLPTMTLSVHLHALRATETVEQSSGNRASGRGKDFSGIYSVCAAAPAPGNYGYVTSKYWLTGDRACGAWSTCTGKIDPSGKEFCLEFTLQGHDECLGPFANCNPTRDSEGHVQATFRLIPSTPTLRATA